MGHRGKLLVWVYPKAGGDGYCFEFKGIDEANDFYKKNKKNPKYYYVEKPTVEFW
jgi:hypothetical protein